MEGGREEFIKITSSFSELIMEYALEREVGVVRWIGLKHILPKIIS